MKKIFLALFIIFALFQSHFFKPGMPDLATGFIVPLSFFEGGPSVASIALIGGILRDASDPNRFWLFTILYPLISLFGYFFRLNVNIKLTFWKIVFTLIVVFLEYSGLYLLYHYDYRVTAYSSLSTFVIALVFTIIWR